MMNGKTVFDSTAIIKYLAKQDGFIDLRPFFEQNKCFVSIITKLELLGWRDITPEDEKRINEFFTGLIVSSIDEKIEVEAIKFTGKQL